MHRSGLSLRCHLISSVLMSILGVMIPAYGLSIATGSEQQSNTNSTSVQSVHLISNWSMRQVVFSNPGTSEKALQNGTYNQWLKVVNNPRYQMQQLIRGGAGPQRRIASTSATSGAGSGSPQTGNSPVPTGPIPTTYPGGVLPRGLRHALIPPESSQSLLWLPNTFAPVFGLSASNPSISPERDWSELIGTDSTVGLGNIPATFTSNPADCTNDFAVFNTSVPGSSSQASILAFNQLYSSCTPNPSVYWAYDSGGAIMTSVSTSLDGTQIVFVQTDNTTGNAELVLLKWAASSGTVSNPTTLTSDSSFPDCTAPCMISIPFTGDPTDSYSAPFVDYGTGNVYVGDDAGNLHKFINVFTDSAPTEATDSWPIAVSTTGGSLAGPLYDPVSGNIFVGDYELSLYSSCGSVGGSPDGGCGFLYSVNTDTGAVTQSAQLDYNLGIYNVIVDPVAEMVYALVGADESTSCSGGSCAAVIQLSPTFSSGASGTEATVGAGYEMLFGGAFDNQYYLSDDPPSGHLYVVGGTGPQNNTLYAITITNNVITSGSATAGPELASNYTNGYYAAGLPITEFCNDGGNPCTSDEGSDYLFLGVLAYGDQFATNPCTNQGESIGCVMGFTAPASGVISTSATPNGTLPESGGPSAISIDYSSNIYFSTLYNQTCATSGGTGGCAVSATQSGLQ